MMKVRFGDDLCLPKPPCGFKKNIIIYFADMTIQDGCVYIIVNKHHTVFYVGVAASVSNRIQQHREKLFPKSFSARYNINKLVYYEFFDSIVDAIEREKQIKKYSRVKKVDLVIKKNPEWKDLIDEVEYPYSLPKPSYRACTLTMEYAITAPAEVIT